MTPLTGGLDVNDDDETARIFTRRASCYVEFHSAVILCDLVKLHSSLFIGARGRLYSIGEGCKCMRFPDLVSA